ncbi:RNA-directed DNA polymerase, eukaryota, reverse transcriptase zinc-binding domain protein [Tanacetum coccineum]
MLEAVADQQLWFWHAYFGVPEANNDLNVLYGSPLFDDLLADKALEAPFQVNKKTYEKGYYLADGIYPQWATFVKSFTIARDLKTQKFKRVQESARKDIERAFGVLQGNFHLNPINLDKWSWMGDTSGQFRVNSLSKSIDCIMLHGSMIGEHHTWNSWIPQKVNFCTWRASIDRLPTRPNLAKRGAVLLFVLCCLCNREIETLDQCFISCPRVITIWRKIWSWCNLASPTVFPSFSIQDISKGCVKTSGCTRTNKVLNGVLHCSIWSIWKWRNRVSHTDSDSTPKIIEEYIFPAIQRI